MITYCRCINIASEQNVQICISFYYNHAKVWIGWCFLFCKTYLHVHILITPMLHNIKIPLICLITMTGMVSIFVLLDWLSCTCISAWHQMLVALQGEGAGTRGACRREASRNCFAKQHQLWSHVTTEQWSSQTQNLQCKNQLNTGQRETDFNS